MRRSLAHHIVGRTISSVRVARADVIHGPSSPRALLVGDQVRSVLRKGKQLAITGHQGGVVTVHLGMSGQLCMVRTTPGNKPDPPSKQRTIAPAGSIRFSELPKHTHLVWSLSNHNVMRFTDPRRFGGVWTCSDLTELERSRWAKLGPDALKITPTELWHRLQGTKRGLKAALLDQALVAGLGNIYVDELLYACQLHPMEPADRIDLQQCGSLVRKMRAMLNGAIERGGSSLRDYVDADNRRGSQQTRHRVYGRAGLPCRRSRCTQVIISKLIAGRTTAWCPQCQGM